jgi:hypothetical protein
MKAPMPETIKLPSRIAMNQLIKSPMTIADYGKITPSNNTNTVSPIVQMLRMQKGQ